MDKGLELEKLIKSSRIPILVLDTRWQALFPPEAKPPHIKKLEKNLMNQLKRQSKLSDDLKNLQSLKKKLMSEIVLNMNEVSSDTKEERRKKKLEKSQQLIIDINDKISKCLNETDEIPLRIKEANEALMLASVKVCYEKMNSNASDIRIISEWIDRTRVELKRQVLIKQDKQEANDRIYTYLHDMFGPEFMELFDNIDGTV